MDLPRPALLKQYSLHLSTEGRAFAYFIADSGSGKVLSVSRNVIAAAHGVTAVLRGDARSRGDLSESEARDAMTAVNYLKMVNEQEALKKKRFNPVMMTVNLFDVGPWQPRLAGIANAFVGWPIVTLFFALSVAVFLLGLRTDWSIGQVFTGILSLEALLTFGLIAPFLKIIHETGHVLAATRYGVRIRKAGINFIGLYPLPFVDASEADLTGSRRQRIIISIAGIFTDIFVGLVAAVIWHFVEGDVMRTIAGRVVVFSTLNSLLFNANPLMKMDGYYAATDAIGQRGLSTRAARAFADTRKSILSLGAAGAMPVSRRGVALVLFGLASFLYRFTILYSLFTQLLPLYLGLGILLSVWGGYVMFVSPILADRTAPTAPLPPAGSPARRWLGRSLVFGALAAILFIPLPYLQRIDMRPDIRDHYTLTINKAGFILPSPGDPSLAVALSNPVLENDIALTMLTLADAQLSASLVQGVDAAQAQIAADNIAATERKLAILREEAASLRVPVKSGTLIWTDPLRPGRYLKDGSAVAALYPDTGATILTGNFPERYVDMFDTQLASVELRFNSKFISIPPDAVELVEVVSMDRASGTRSFTIRLSLPIAPADLVGADVKARLRFASAPIWSHIIFWLDGRIAAFRDAQIADRESRIGSGN